MAVDPIGGKPKKTPSASDLARGAGKKPKPKPTAPSVGLKPPGGKSLAERLKERWGKGPSAPGGPSGGPPSGDKDDKDKERRRGMYEFLEEQKEAQAAADAEAARIQQSRELDLITQYARKMEPVAGLGQVTAGGGPITPQVDTERLSAADRAEALRQQWASEQQRTLARQVDGPLDIVSPPPVTPGGRLHPMARPGYEGPTTYPGPGAEFAPAPTLMPSGQSDRARAAEMARLEGLAEGILGGTVPITGETIFGGPRAQAQNVPWGSLGFDSHSEGNKWANDFKEQNGYWPWEGPYDEDENLARNISNYLGAGPEAPTEEDLYPPVEQYIPEEFAEDYGWGGFGGGGFMPYFYGGGGGGGYEQPLPPWFYATQGYGV